MIEPQDDGAVFEVAPPVREGRIRYVPGKGYQFVPFAPSNPTIKDAAYKKKKDKRRIANRKARATKRQQRRSQS